MILCVNMSGEDGNEHVVPRIEQRRIFTTPWNFWRARPWPGVPGVTISTVLYLFPQLFIIADQRREKKGVTDRLSRCSISIAWLPNTAERFNHGDHWSSRGQREMNPFYNSSNICYKRCVSMTVIFFFRAPHRPCKLVRSGRTEDLNRYLKTLMNIDEETKKK